MTDSQLLIGIIENDDELDPIRHTEAYKTLMNEYFN